MKNSKTQEVFSLRLSKGNESHLVCLISEILYGFILSYNFFIIKLRRRKSLKLQEKVAKHYVADNELIWHMAYNIIYYNKQTHTQRQQAEIC